MKNFKMLFAMGLSVVSFTNFANAQSSSNPVVTTPSPEVSLCSFDGEGAVMTAYGCAPQGKCPIGYGMLNDACYPGNAANAGGLVEVKSDVACPAGNFMTQIGCLPQASCHNGEVFYNNSCYVLIEDTYKGHVQGYDGGHGGGYPYGN